MFKYLRLLSVSKFNNLSCHRDNLRMNRINNNILEKIFQLSTEPFYVGNETVATTNDETKKEEN